MSYMYIGYMWLPYSRKNWRGIKFDGLAVYITTAKLKSANISWQSVPNRQSTNILAIAILGSTAKSNSSQYFRLYGIYNLHGVHQSTPTPKDLRIKERTYSFPPKDASVERIGEDTREKEWILVVVVAQVVVVNCIVIEIERGTLIDSNWCTLQ